MLAHRTPWLTHVMRFVTAFGGSAVLVPVIVVVGLVLRRRRGTWAPLEARLGRRVRAAG